MPVWNGQDYREDRKGSPSGSLAPRGDSRISMNVKVPWADLVSQGASKAFLGYSQVSVNGAGGGFWPGAAVGAKWFQYTNPFVHPDWPGGFFLCESFDKFEGDVPDGQTAWGSANFDDANVTLGFKSVPDGYQVLPDANVLVPAAYDPARYPGTGLPVEYWVNRNMAVQETAAVKAQSIPPVNSGLVWGSDLTAASLAAYVPLYETRIKIEWYPVPIFGFNDAAFAALVGTTNLHPFPEPPPIAVPPSWLNSRPAGTLVMGTAGKKMIRQGDMTWAWKITLNLAYFPYGANYFYRYNRPDAAGGPGYDFLRRRTSATSVLFPAANWNGAFLPLP